LIRAEWKSPTSRLVELGELGREHLPRRRRQRLPHEQRPRIVLDGGERRRKQLDDRQPPAVRGLLASRTHLAHDLRRADQHGGQDDRRG